LVLDFVLFSWFFSFSIFFFFFSFLPEQYLAQQKALPLSFPSIVPQMSRRHPDFVGTILSDDEDNNQVGVMVDDDDDDDDLQMKKTSAKEEESKTKKNKKKPQKKTAGMKRKAPHTGLDASDAEEDNEEDSKNALDYSDLEDGPEQPSSSSSSSSSSWEQEMKIQRDKILRQSGSKQTDLKEKISRALAENKTNPSLVDELMADLPEEEKQLEEQEQEPQETKEDEEEVKVEDDDDDDDDDDQDYEKDENGDRIKQLKKAKPSDENNNKGRKSHIIQATTVDTTDAKKKARDFGDLKLSRQLLNACRDLGYKQPTPIQAAVCLSLWLCLSVLFLSICLSSTPCLSATVSNLKQNRDWSLLCTGGQ
jgi:hypothetical protein